MTTEELTNKLKEYDDIDQFLDDNANEFNENAFRDYLEELLKRKSDNISKLAKNSDISLPYAYDIFSGRKNSPRKYILLKLAFGLALNLDETNRLLTLGGTATLRSKVRQESIIMFCINKGFSLDEANELLYSYDLDTL